MGKAANKIKDFFGKVGKGLDKAVDWGIEKTGTVASTFKSVMPFGNADKIILYGGLGIVGAVILWTFMNPKETTQLVVAGANTAQQGLRTAAALPIPL